MKEKMTLIVTDKCVIALKADEALTLKDVIDRLNSGALRIEALRNITGPDNERQWVFPNGDHVGRAAVRYARAKKFIIEKGQSHARNLIFNNLPDWKTLAQGKPLTAPLKEAVKKNGKVEEHSQNDLIVQVEKYMDSLKAIDEIGALYKFLKHLKKEKK